MHGYGPTRFFGNNSTCWGRRWGALATSPGCSRSLRTVCDPSSIAYSRSRRSQRPPSASVPAISSERSSSPLRNAASPLRAMIGARFVVVVAGDEPWLPQALECARLAPNGLPVIGLPYLVLFRLTTARSADARELER